MKHIHYRQFASCQRFKINEPLRYDMTVFVSHSPSTKSMISIRGSFALPMMTPGGPALTISAMKNSEFSGV